MREATRSVAASSPPPYPQVRARHTERENLERELAEARAARSRSLVWTAMFGVGPAAVLAVALAAATGRVEVAVGLFGLGVVVEVARLRRLGRLVRNLRRALEDPMDGS